MGGHVIERKFNTESSYVDIPSTFEAADKISGCRLDRRKNYAIIDGQVAESSSWVEACSGCYEGHYAWTEKGFGCDECGYTGRRRQSYWVPLHPPAEEPTRE